MAKEAQYLSHVRHELRNQLVVIRESISQVLDGLGNKDCSKCMPLLKPSLECSDKLNNLIETLLRDDALESSLENLKKELVTVIAHEVRTPLAVIKDGLAQISESNTHAFSESQRRLLVSVKESADRLTDSIENMLETSWDNIIKSSREKHA